MGTDWLASFVLANIIPCFSTCGSLCLLSASCWFLARLTLISVYYKNCTNHINSFSICILKSLHWLWFFIGVSVNTATSAFNEHRKFNIKHFNNKTDEFTTAWTAFAYYHLANSSCSLCYVFFAWRSKINTVSTPTCFNLRTTGWIVTKFYKSNMSLEGTPNLYFLMSYSYAQTHQVWVTIALTSKFGNHTNHKNYSNQSYTFNIWTIWNS
jgi:hypothetical protein